MPKLFQGIKWGTKSVLRNTINLLNNKPYILPELNDIDTYEDLIDHPSLLKLYKYLLLSAQFYPIILDFPYIKN